MSTQLMKLPKNSEWKLFEGEELPQHIFDAIVKSNGFKSGQWCQGAVYYKGDMNTSLDWIVTTDDGGYYKVGAEFMVWRLLRNPNAEHGQFGGFAIWTVGSLKKTIKSIMNTGTAERDPDYQS